MEGSLESFRAWRAPRALSGDHGSTHIQLATMDGRRRLPRRDDQDASLASLVVWFRSVETSLLIISDSPQNKATNTFPKQKQKEHLAWFAKVNLLTF